MIDVNIKGVANVIRHFVPAWSRERSGVIVNFSSGWGRSTSPEVAPYCATKWAIEGLTQALAQELPKGMAAVALNPGIIDTDMLRSCFGDSAGLYPDAEKWGRAGGRLYSENQRQGQRRAAHGAQAVAARQVGGRQRSCRSQRRLAPELHRQRRPSTPRHLPPCATSFL